MYGGSCIGCCGDGSVVSLALFLSLLVLLTSGCEQFALGEEGLLCELGLVLELDQVPGLISHCLFQDHNH